MIVDLHLKEKVSVKSIVKEHGLHKTQILNWCKWYKANGVARQMTGKSKAGMNSLEQEVKQLRMENDLLKKFHELLRQETKRK